MSILFRSSTNEWLYNLIVISQLMWGVESHGYTVLYRKLYPFAETDLLNCRYFKNCGRPTF